MTLKVYTDPVEFLKITEAILLKNEAENNLLLGVLACVIAGQYPGKLPFMAHLENKSNHNLVMMCNPPYPVVFAFHENIPEKQLLEKVLLSLADYLGDDFTGITANKELSAALVNLWQEIKGIPATINTAMRIYKLENVIPVEGVPGMMRPAEKGDESMLLDWFAGYTREAIHEEPDPIRIGRKINRILTADPGLQGLMLWEVNDIPVSMAGYSGPTPNGMRVGMVFTPKGIRCSGYASACTAGVSQHLLDRKYRFCFLYTDLHNPTTNKIYQQIGYRPVCDVDRYDFF